MVFNDSLEGYQFLNFQALSTLLSLSRAFGLENIDFPCVLLLLGSKTLIFLVFYGFWARKH